MSNEVVNPWVVQPPKQTAQVPIGMYAVAFKGIEEVKLPDGSPKWRIAYEVQSGPSAGKIASALVDKTINPNTLSGRLIAGILGRPIVAGENVQAAIEACVGKSYVVSVQPGPKGGKPGVKSCGVPPTM